MPKINVYLPDDLAEAVKEAGIPVSAVCQRALEQAVRRVAAIRESDLADLDGEPTGALAHLTPKMLTVLRTAVDRARQAGAATVGTGHLLAAMLDQGDNLALRVLRAMDVEPHRIGRDLAARQTGGSDASEPGPAPRRFDGPAAAALELAVTEATGLGHNYVGSEHLVIGLALEPDGVAGDVLRAAGAEARPLRRAVTAALAGYAHLRAASAPAAPAQAPSATQAEQVQQMLAAVVRRELEPLGRRIAHLESHLGTSVDD